MADSEAVELLMAARRLVGLGLLARETDPRLIDVLVDGCGFRYLARFWTHTGLFETNDCGWHLRFEGVAGAALARRRVAEEWMRAGAPYEWARAEADSALDALLSETVGTAWGTA